MADIPNITVSRCGHSELDELVNFAKRMHKKGNRLPSQDKNTILQKYREYRESNLLNLFIVKDERKIIGCSGYIPFKALFKNKKVEGIVGSDIVIDPEYSRNFRSLPALLFRNYRKFIMEDKSFCINFPISEAIAQSFKAAQWKNFSYVDVFSNSLTIDILPAISGSSIEIKHVSYFDKDMKVFFKTISGQHQFILNADADFLNWKYFKSPYADYVVFIATKKNKIVGYVVAQNRKLIIEIVDLVINIDYPVVMPLLVYKLFNFMAQERIVKATCYLGHKTYIDIARKIGFFYNRTYECLFFKLSSLFSAIGPSDIAKSDNRLYHFNGFTNYLY